MLLEQGVLLLTEKTVLYSEEIKEYKIDKLNADYGERKMMRSLGLDSVSYL